LKYVPREQPPPEPSDTPAKEGGPLQFLFYFILTFLVPYLLVITLLHYLPIDIIPDKLEDKMGQWMLKESKDSPSPSTVEIQKILKSITPNQPRMPLSARVIEDPAINAAAYPGGRLVIYRGLYDLLDTEAQKTAVLAHEVGHSELNHYGYRLSTALALIPFNWALNLAGLGQLDAVSEYLFLSFSRSEERACDEFSAKILWKKYGSLQGAIDAYDHLKSAGIDSKLLKYSSSHPLTQERIDHFKYLEKEWNSMK